MTKLNRRARRAKASVERRRGRELPEELVQVTLPPEDLTRSRTGPGAGKGKRCKPLGSNRGS